MTQPPSTELAKLCDALIEEIARLRSILSEQLCNCGVSRPSQIINPTAHQEWCRYRQTGVEQCEAKHTRD